MKENIVRFCKLRNNRSEWKYDSGKNIYELGGRERHWIILYLTDGLINREGDAQRDKCVGDLNKKEGTRQVV